MTREKFLNPLAYREIRCPVRMKFQRKFGIRTFKLKNEFTTIYMYIWIREFFLHVCFGSDATDETLLLEMYM